MSKKSWITPELIVIVRSKPEESVLEGCKTNSLLVAGPSDPENPTNCVGSSLVEGGTTEPACRGRAQT